MKKSSKKTIAVFLCVVLTLTAAPLSDFVGLDLMSLFDFKAEAATYSGTCGDNLTWTLDTDTGLLEITGNGAMWDCSLWATAPWYSYKSNIKSVKISDGVTNIGNYTFYFYENINGISLGKDVKTIGEGAFTGCSFSEIVIPVGVTEIKYGAFGSCSNLTKIIIPDSVTNIGEYAFLNCENLTDVSLGNSLKSIGHYAFSECSKLTDITIPDSVIYLGAQAFMYCKNLTDVKLSNKLEYIYGNAFRDCSKLENIIIPDSVVYLGEEAFYNCENLKFIHIPETVNEIGARIISSDSSAYICSATADCYAKTYAVSNGFEFKICDHGEFESTIVSGECGENLTWTLYESDLLEIIGTGEMTDWESSSDVPWCSYRSRINSVNIGESVTTISDYALYGCNSLESITIPDSVTTIGDYAFYSCDSLIDVYYGSTKEDWNKIAIGSDNESLISATIHHNYGKPLITPANGAVVDNENGTIYGLDVGIDSLDGYTDIVVDGAEWVYEETQNGFGTGTVAKLQLNGETVAEYTVVIFGDIDGDGWYDANDAFIVNMIAGGLIDESRLNEAMRKAADCNHDGVINELDFDLLINASVLLDDVDQLATQSDLSENSVYIQYCSLVDQTAGEETNLALVPTPDETLSDSAADEINIEVIFTIILEFVQKIFSFIFSLIIK